jgi:hypothetical protein
MEKIWKRYKDTSYLISEYGDVVNSDNGYALSSFDNGRGYLVINLSIHNFQKKFKIHRLVADCFLERSLIENYEINHIDGNKYNNFYKNLERVSHAKNMKHASENGLMVNGEEHCASKLSENDVKEIRYLFSIGLTDVEVRKIFPIGPGTMSKIRKRKIWRDVEPYLEYPFETPSVHSPKKKLCSGDIPIIRKLHEEGQSNGSIAKRFCVASATISNILLGKTWKNY